MKKILVLLFSIMVFAGYSQDNFIYSRSSTFPKALTSGQKVITLDSAFTFTLTHAVTASQTLAYAIGQGWVSAPVSSAMIPVQIVKDLTTSADATIKFTVPKNYTWALQVDQTAHKVHDTIAVSILASVKGNNYNQYFNLTPIKSKSVTHTDIFDDFVLPESYFELFLDMGTADTCTFNAYLNLKPINQ